MNKDGDQLNKLVKALSRFLDQNELINHLARVLAYASKTGRVYYQQIQGVTKGDLDEVLLEANQWRFLLPVRTVKSAAWEDRLLLVKPGEVYEMPNIIKYLVQNASQTGEWQPGQALAELFKAMGDPDWERIPTLVKRMGKGAKDRRINAVQIGEICTQLGLKERLDQLIAELKASGVISPKLTPFPEVHQERAPIYELNPALFINKGMME